MIGIIGAMDEEITLLQTKIDNQKTIEVANSLFITGLIGGKEVVLLKSGIGKVNAALGTTILHEQFKPSYIINTGSAGGFKEELKVGDIVISSEVVQHDVDVTAFGYVHGQVPGLPDTFKADSSLINRAKQAVGQLEINYEVGLIATGDQFMQNPEYVQTVRTKFPSMIAADMEAGAIAQICYQYGTPFVVIRALSDIAGKTSSISFDTFLKTAATNAAQLILAVIEDS